MKQVVRCKSVGEPVEAVVGWSGVDSTDFVGMISESIVNSLLSLAVAGRPAWTGWKP
jgi:hypothetical protein